MTRLTLSAPFFLGATLAVLLGGCASKPQVPFKLDCRGGQNRFEECGQFFDTSNECRAAQQRMIRSPGFRARDRGTCIQNKRQD